MGQKEKKMKDTYWKATTEHGTTYTYTGGSIWIDSKRHGKCPIRASRGIKAVDRSRLEQLGSDAEMWEVIRESEKVEIPVVGKAIYISNFIEWRLSTEVVKVETWEKENDNSH